MTIDKAKLNYDFVIWGTACLLIAVVGFWHSYVVPVAVGKNQAISPAMPWHVLSTLVWLLLLIVQPLLIQWRKFRAHRWIGWIGALVAIAVVVTGAAVQFDVMPKYAKANDFDNAVAIPFIRLTLLFGFGICVSLAIVLRSRAEWHKRLILLGTFPLLQSPFDRMGKHIFGIPEASGLGGSGWSFRIDVSISHLGSMENRPLSSCYKMGYCTTFCLLFLEPHSCNERMVATSCRAAFAKVIRTSIFRVATQKGRSV